MMLNFFLVAFRSMVRNRLYFFVSVAGLSVGLATVLLIFHYLRQELSFDEFHSRNDRIVRINSHFTENDDSRITSRTPFPLKAILLQDFPEVEQVARFGAIARSRFPLSYKGTVYYEDISFADPDFLTLFDFQMLRGDREHALDNPNSILLTEETAQRYFGNEDPIGKVLRYQNRVDLTVTGILRNVPTNSHLQFDVLLPIEFQRRDWRVAQNNFYDLEEDWLWNGSWTYVLLRAGTDATSFEQKIHQLPRKYYSKDAREKYRYRVQPLTLLHFAIDVTGTQTPSSSKTQLLAIFSIGLFVFFLAAVNFINLSTAQAPTRGKEVGLRKTLGALRLQLIAQFLSETCLVVCASAVVAVFLTQLTAPFFSNIIGKPLEMHWDSSLLGYVLVGILFITAAAGIFPAFVMSNPNPIHALKGRLVGERSSVFSLRSGLVIFQLVVSVLLIGAILIIREQIDFMHNKDVGFDRSRVVVIRNGATFYAYEAFKQRLTRVTGIEDVYRGYIPGGLGWSVSWKVEGKQDSHTIPMQLVADNFVPMFGLRVVAGRDFIQGLAADTTAALINEKMAHDMGWANTDAIGRRLSYIGGNDNKTLVELRVIGIVRNANLESLYKPVQAMVFQQSAWGDMAVKINGNTNELIGTIGKIYKEIAPDWPFEYGFLEEDISSLYQQEERLADLIQILAALAVVICFTGLLALCSFTTRQRTREIAIRKVHGASVWQVWVLLGRYFSKLALLSLTLAIPVSYFFAQEWLATFAFSIHPGVAIYLKMIGIVSLLIATSIWYHVRKTSRVNPAKILKTE